MRLSVIVPVYNMAGGGKLAFCMDSLLNQTIEDYEIIAVDDASTDNSLEVLREYERKYPGKVRVVTYGQNKRQGGARNEGMKVAQGEWIGFIDSDDWVTPDYYEKLLNKAEETGADVVGCDYNLVSEHTFEIGKVVVNNTEDQTGVLDVEKHKKLLVNPGSMVVKVYRHSVIRENGLSFPEGIFYEDNCAAPLWSLHFTHFERVPEPLYYYYQHDSSTVHGISEERCRDRMRAKELFYEECKSRDLLEFYYAEIEYRFGWLYYVVTLLSYMQGAKHPKLSFVKELRRGVIERFPNFEQNEYYRSLTEAPLQKLIAMQGQSDLKYYCYHRLQLLVRRVKGMLRR